jgi:hypothetical protein
MSKLFVVFELSHDSNPAHGVYTSLQLAVLSAIRVEENGATDYGLSVLVFNVDQEIELETLSDDKESSTSVKYIDTTVVNVERLDTGDDIVSIQVELSIEHLANVGVDITVLINGVCSECGFNIGNIKHMEESVVFELIKV